MMVNRVAIFSLALFSIIMLVATVINRELAEDVDKAQEAKLEALQKEIDANFVNIDANFETLFADTRTIGETLRATTTQATNAHTRIEYYRDVLLIVSKTCPGRMKLPYLASFSEPSPPTAEGLTRIPKTRSLRAQRWTPTNSRSWASVQMGSSRSISATTQSGASETTPGPFFQIALK